MNPGSLARVISGLTIELALQGIDQVMGKEYTISIYSKI